MAVTFQVTFDAADPAGLAAFWAATLRYVLEPPPPGYATWDEFADSIGMPAEERHRYAAAVDPDGVGPRLFFQRVPEPKAAKNRVHLDLNVGGGRDALPEERRARVAEVAMQLVGRGARVIAEHDEHGSHWIVMADPEGNEFCLQ